MIQTVFMVDGISLFIAFNLSYLFRSLKRKLFQKSKDFPEAFKSNFLKQTFR